jgi:hypothetical protein
MKLPRRQILRFVPAALAAATLSNTAGAQPIPTQFSAAVAATKEIGVLSGIRIERSERGMPGEFDWVDKLSVDELRLLADGKLDIASYRQSDEQPSRRPVIN